MGVFKGKRRWGLYLSKTQKSFRRARLGKNKPQQRGTRKIVHTSTVAGGKVFMSDFFIRIKYY